jgi:hypothetical protein
MNIPQQTDSKKIARIIANLSMKIIHNYKNLFRLWFYGFEKALWGQINSRICVFMLLS